MVRPSADAVKALLDVQPLKFWPLAVAGAVTWTDWVASAPADKVPPAFGVIGAGVPAVPGPVQLVVLYVVAVTLPVVTPLVVKRILPSVKMWVAVPEIAPVAVTL